MRPKSRSNDSIGGAAPFSGSQLPTHGDMAMQWRQTRLELQQETPGRQVSNRHVAKTVFKSMCITANALSDRNHGRELKRFSMCYKS